MSRVYREHAPTYYLEIPGLMVCLFIPPLIVHVWRYICQQRSSFFWPVFCNIYSLSSNHPVFRTPADTYTHSSDISSHTYVGLLLLSLQLEPRYPDRTPTPHTQLPSITDASWPECLVDSHNLEFLGSTEIAGLGWAGVGSMV